ncbi:MAG: HAMP domain-containing histidine kinase [Bacteroidetes bacterium]|nr:HAMP domain-containing histidine kinase [Bacteroidota bacterium]
MKRNLILSAGILAIVVLIAVQTFIVGQIWRQNETLLLVKYRQMAVNGLDFFEKEYRTNGFDTAFYYIDYYSSLVLQTNEFRNSSGEELDTVKRIVLNEVRRMLDEKQYLSKLLSDYLHKHKVDGNITVLIDINYFDLIDLNTTHTLYVSENYLNSRTDKSRILVSRFRNEDNFHRISFDFYIDITDRRAIIMRDIAISLVMSSFSIVVVILIFILAYRNLLEERRLSDLKTDFINNMTHELKTPLSTISVAGKTLELEQVISNREKIIETARLIGKQSVNLNQLINLILEISIWERTEFEPEIKPVAVGPVLNEIIAGFRTGTAGKAVITDNISLEGLTINADVTYFTTMINNLLSNAIKYSPGDTRVNVEAYADGKEIFISIKDNGIGIGKQHQKHIFDKFYRVSHGDIHKTKGLGLGLYYVNRIVNAHGGRVELESQPGKGSTFTVILPLY